MLIRNAVGVAVCAMAACCLGADYALDLRPKGMRLASAAMPDSTEGVLRRTSLGAGGTGVAALRVGDRLSFRLFDDVETTLVLRERTESPLGGETFLAAAEDASMCSAVVMQDANGLTASVSDVAGNRVYTVVSTASDVTVREIDPNAGVCEPGPTVVPDLSDAPVDAKMLSAAAADQPATLIDVLVAFDRSAAAWASRNGGGITNFATMAVQGMNTVIANTGFSSAFRFRLVGAMAVDANGGSDLDGTLSAARYGTGDWAAVKAMRDRVGADTVTVLIDTGSAYGTTGLGYSLSDPGRLAAFSESAYSVCAVRAVTQSYTMMHETGHNLGAGHSDRQTDSPGPQLYSYSAGYYFTAKGTAYHTVMAYDEDGFYTRVPYFSSPNFSYEGVAVGDATHDNVKTIGNTYAAATKWRKQVVPMSYDVFFSPEGGSVFTDSTTVAMTPGKAGLPIRYTLDGSMPTTRSTLYTAPVTLTKTTTIRAVTVTDGVAGPVFEATYSASDLGAGVDASQLDWRTDEDYPWTFQTSDTYDGVDAVQCARLPTGENRNTWLETDVTGPTTMSFAFKRGYLYASTFSVRCDGDVLFTYEEGGYPNDWRVVEVDVPAGQHAIRFNFNQRGYYPDVFNGIYLDQVRFDALSRPPTISPATTSDETTAATFTGSTLVALTPPAGKTGTLYYTLDGDDPMGLNGVMYAGPITLTRSTRVRAVFVEGGKDSSVEVGGLYLERHPVKPGEWTTDVDGVKSAAAQDGRLICVMRGNYGGCGITQRFYDNVALTPAFLSWAEANDIYLVRADSTTDLDCQRAISWFESLMSSYGDSGGYYYTRMYFARPSSPMSAIARGGAGGDLSQIGSAAYDGTVKSAVDGFASVLGESVPSAPTTSAPSLVADYPVSVTLANPNGGGTIYYTLDGSAPTRESARYTGPLAISKSTTLKAAVWPSSGCSSAVLVKDFQSYGDVLGTSGVAWSSGGAHPWEVDASAERTVKAAHVEKTAYTSSLQAAVSGKGRLVFTLRGSSNAGSNKIVFKMNGTQKYSYGYSETYGTSRTVTLTNEVTATGATTFTWTYSVENVSYHYYFNGAWLYDVQWIPEGGVVTPGGTTPYTPSGWTTPIAVDGDWLIARGLAKAGDSAASVAATLAANGRNGIPRYQSYLLGMEPESDVPADEQLKVTMTGFDANGLPVIDYEPKPKDATKVTYMKLGKSGLDSGADWIEVTDANKDIMRFYRIKVVIAPRMTE